VFFLPAVLDQRRVETARGRLATLLPAVEAGNLSAVADAVAVEVPPSARNTPSGWAYVRQRVDQLMRDGLAPALAGLADQVPVSELGALAGVTARSLVIACGGDDLHPVEVAERLAATLPGAALHVYDRPGVVWTARADLRERVAAFLNG
jgi:pimeloyl-ACP methyl ester carboxylesterase